MTRTQKKPCTGAKIRTLAQSWRIFPRAGATRTRDPENPHHETQTLSLPELSGMFARTGRRNNGVPGTKRARQEQPDGGHIHDRHRQITTLFF